MMAHAGAAEEYDGNGDATNDAELCMVVMMLARMMSNELMIPMLMTLTVVAARGTADGRWRHQR